MIPKFDHNNVTPPHIGDPTDINQLSPYPSNTMEFCSHFATSKERVEILKGFLKFRQQLQNFGVVEGFQWLDGSFTENVEVTLGRAPQDLDAVTFYKNLNPDQEKTIIQTFPDFIDFNESKRNFKVDHYPVDFGFKPEFTIESTRYWLQLFSHNRLSIWKGIIRIELNTPKIDANAWNFLTNLVI